jgi:carboxymethylenebutenolidase
MKPIKKEQISQEVFDLYDDYAHNRIDRRKFLEKLSIYAVGGITLGSLLSFVSPNYIGTALIKQDDQRIISDFITYNSPKGGGDIKALYSKPANANTKLPGVIVVHENRGLNPYIEDVGRQLAVDGFLSLAPDALTPLGGYPENDDEGRALQRQRDRMEMLEDFIAAAYFLKTHPDCNGNMGVVGFCFGGWVSNMMAVKMPELLAAVPYYGGQPTAEEAAQVKTPLLLHFAELDTRVNAGWPNYEAILKSNKVEYESHFYPNVNHGFHNTSTPRYDQEAAELSWQRTITFFKNKLG